MNTASSPRAGERISDGATATSPFHWFVEFYGIMHKGGFDVVIGNPPYINCKSLEYVVQSPSP